MKAAPPVVSIVARVWPFGLFAGATAPHPDGARIAQGEHTADGITAEVFYLYPTPAAGARTPAEAEAEAERVRYLVSHAAQAVTRAAYERRAAEAADPKFAAWAALRAERGDTPDAKAHARQAAHIDALLPAVSAGAAAGAALRADLESAGGPLTADEDNAVALAAAYLSGYVRGEAEAAEAAPAEPKKRGRPRRTRPDVVAQQTWPELEAVYFGVVVDGKGATRDVVDGKNATPAVGKNAPWQDKPGEVALTHKRRGSPLSLHFGANTVDTAEKDLAPLPHADSYEGLRELLERVAGPRAGSLLNYCMARAVAEPAGFVVTIGDFVNESGAPPRSEREREAREREAWDTVRVFTHTAVFGRRRACKPKKGEADILSTVGLLITILELADEPGQLTLDGSRPPREMTLVAAPGIRRVVEERPEVLHFFTDWRPQAQLPAGRGVQAWRDGIARALGQRWRTNAKDAKTVRQGKNADGTDKPPKLQTRDFTRRELLDYASPDPQYADVLAGSDPRRAVEYWDAAIALLRQLDADGNEGVIGAGRGDYVEHGPAPWRKPKGWPKGKLYKPQGWQEAWLSQKLTIRPGPAGQAIMRDVKAKAAAARAKAAAARKKRAK